LGISVIKTQYFDIFEGNILNMKKFLLIAIHLVLPVSIFAQILNKSGLQEFKGYFDFYYDQKEDKIYLEVKDLDSEFLYVNSLARGLGSNDIGLDRGQLGRSVS